ncbi:MAG: hypothetical protein MZV49_00635 [Rhodopseudomonas palustris]|nr:hypothetical protein [Rhodopseudomonas palustris]
MVAGDPGHPEVAGLMARAGENGAVAANARSAETLDVENRTLLLAQSTVDPEPSPPSATLWPQRVPGLENRGHDLPLPQEPPGRHPRLRRTAGLRRARGRHGVPRTAGFCTRPPAPETETRFLIEAPDELKRALFQERPSCRHFRRRFDAPVAAGRDAPVPRKHREQPERVEK